MSADLNDRVNLVFRKVFQDPSLELNDATTAEHISMWDSLTHMELIAAIEQEFSIVFQLEEVLDFSCVGDMKKCIEQKIQSFK